MTTFVLVHGAFLGGWCWSRVEKLLRDQGHEVYGPSLTGLGDRAHLLSDQIGLSTQINDVLGVIESHDLTDIVLCGHSYGGIVITGVADQLADRVQTLVYLDALVPENANSMFDLIPPFFQESFESGAALDGGLSVPPMSAEDFGVGEADRAWVDEKSGNHPIKCFSERIALSGAYRSIANRHYVLAPAFEHPSTHANYNQFKDDPTWQTHTVSGGHHVMVDNPAALAEILLSV
jgi:pimeloyl-ACP methyl ester carboxylesterase